jgi:Ran GTPase-activating protein (RanGAP) involved in mRNA processing and transport
MLNVVGNQQLSDAGVENLHLLPSTLTDLALSQCGLTAAAVKHVCEMLSTNQSLTRLVMWGNPFGDEIAKHIGDMLQVNKIIRELCIFECNISPTGYSYLSDGLKKHNDALQEISPVSQN